MKKYFNIIKYVVSTLLIGLYVLILHGNDIASIWYKFITNGKSCGNLCFDRLEIDIYQIVLIPTLSIILVGLICQGIFIMHALIKSSINKTDLSHDDIAQTPLSNDIEFILGAVNPLLRKVFIVIIVLFSVSVFLFWVISTAITAFGY